MSNWPPRCSAIASRDRAATSTGYKYSNKSNNASGVFQAIAKAGDGDVTSTDTQFKATLR